MIAVVHHPIVASVVAVLVGAVVVGLWAWATFDARLADAGIGATA